MLISTTFPLLEVLLAFLYPAYASFKCLKYGDAEELKQWLVRWIVTAGFIFFTRVCDLFLTWLPCYYETKLLFLIWMVLPQTQGSVYLYNNYFLGALEAHELQVDRSLERAHTQMREHASSVMSGGATIISSHTTSIVERTNNYLIQSILAKHIETDTSKKQPVS